MDDFLITAEDGSEFEIQAFLNADFQRSDPDDAVFVITIDALGEQEIFRLARPTIH